MHRNDYLWESYECGTDCRYLYWIMYIIEIGRFDWNYLCMVGYYWNGDREEIGCNSIFD